MKSFNLTLFNFFISSIIIGAIIYFFGFTILQSLLTGFTLGGVSSAFVIPLIKELKLGNKTQLILTFESAFTDVLCIVFAFAVIEIIILNTIDFNNIIYTVIIFTMVLSSLMVFKEKIAYSKNVA